MTEWSGWHTSVRHRGSPPAALVVSVLAGCVGDDDDGAEDVDRPMPRCPAPETLAPVPVDATIPGGTLAGEADSSIDEVLADDTVTAEELDEAYRRYVECLADGGGVGRYAYDIDLRTGLVIDWIVDEDDPAAIDRDVLSASCSRRHLGDLTRRFEQQNPAPDDLAARQRASIVTCVEAVSPEAAANLPAAISVGTAGEASSLGELQLDPAALDPESLGADADDIAAVSACIAAVGAEWHAFG